MRFLQACSISVQENRLEQHLNFATKRALRIHLTMAKPEGEFCGGPVILQLTFTVHSNTTNGT